MSFLEAAWNKKAQWLILLWPISILFRLLAFCRRRLQQVSSRPSHINAPIVVIGNISVGGTGKTPVVITLATNLKSLGIHAGIISRGYGGSAAVYPFIVSPHSEVNVCGDEALLIQDKTNCPVVVGPDRNAALELLIQKFGKEIDIVISDDGLQHYNLYRDLEIAVVDGNRLFGNGLCLPAGPLREPVSRLMEVDHIIVNGGSNNKKKNPENVSYESSQTNLESDFTDHVLANAHTMLLKPTFLINLLSGERRPFLGAPFNIGNKIQAVSAIGNPDRFYALLERLPHQVEKFSFPDHHLYQEEDFETYGIDMKQPIVMTEKDAVKCRDFANPSFWVLEVAVILPNGFTETLVEQLNLK
jgi:tetraacyldisaccharide 4'-kinase